MGRKTTLKEGGGRRAESIIVSGGTEYPKTKENREDEVLRGI